MNNRDSIGCIAYRGGGIRRMVTVSQPEAEVVVELVDKWRIDVGDMQSYRIHNLGNQQS